MICASIPCACFKKPVKKTARKASASKPVTQEPVVEVPEVTTTRPNSHDSMREAAAKAQPTFKTLTSNLVKIERDIPRDDPDFISAVKTLGGMLHTSELSLYASLIRINTPRDRATAWKKRRTQ